MTRISIICVASMTAALLAWSADDAGAEVKVKTPVLPKVSVPKSNPPKSHPKSIAIVSFGVSHTQVVGNSGKGGARAGKLPFGGGMVVHGNSATTPCTLCSNLPAPKSP